MNTSITNFRFPFSAGQPATAPEVETAINPECATCEDFEAHGGPCRGQTGELRPSGKSCPIHHPAESTGPLLELFGEVEPTNVPPAAGFPPAPSLFLRPAPVSPRRSGTFDNSPTAAAGDGLQSEFSVTGERRASCPPPRFSYGQK